MTASQIFVTILVSFAAACLQRVSGFGFAIIATPLLSFVMPVRVAVVVIALVSYPNALLNWTSRPRGG